MRYCPPNIRLRIAGVDAVGDRPLGVWTTESIQGVDVDFLALRRLDPGNQRRIIPHSFSMLLGMIRYRRLLRSETIQTHRVELGAAAQLLFRHSRHVQFLHIDGKDSLAAGSDSFWKYLKTGYSLVERRALPHASDVVVFSGQGADRLSKLDAPVRFSPTWFDPEMAFPPEHYAPANRLIMVARIEPPKDPLLAVNVVALLPEKYTLTVVGDGTLRRAMEQEAHRLGIANRVTFTGAVNKARVGELMREHGTMIVTSHYEGFSRAVVEGLASGLRVVTTQGGEPNGLVKDGINGRRVQTRSAEEFAQLIQTAGEIAPRDAIHSVEHLSAQRIVSEVLRE